LAFDHLVICTGSSQSFPIKDVEALTIEERRLRIIGEQNRIKSAESILVVGGGAVGVEVMGELVNVFTLKNL